MKYCVKEVSTLTQDLCGATQYFGDMYVAGTCQYKKCAAECEEGTYSFEYQGQTYSRQRYCCNDKNDCNAAFSSMSVKSVCLLVSLIIGFYLLFV
jgi:hypothetical protein